ncbi:hypothetical protein QBC42DRAFT_264674 [Cladorrhinum samala]|uniref:Uncharacterized protein n=1 Tax=Cladorrhinum samala TaxID=585594 RepID=A0AAV9HSU6_9PEZI|nr:hypothetical protein QBC42DRAFT_264674 [Cladorrhinum samala]
MSNNTFKLSAGPDTDIWRKPPSKDIFNAPHTKPETKPLGSFRSATVTIPSKSYTHQYDQSGLLLTFSRPPSGSSSSSSSQSPSPEKWIKVGVEYYNSVPRFSVVACDAWADWSVAPLAIEPGNEWVTLSVEKEGDSKGLSLWVYQVLDGGKRKEPVREICWVFGGGNTLGKGEADEEEWELSVSAMAARPAQGNIGHLEIEGKDLIVKWE